MSVIKFSSKLRDYDVHFVDTTDFLSQFQRFAQRCFVVDENLWKLHSNGALRALANEELIVLPIDEERKSLEMVQELYDRLIERAAKRNMTMVSIGGGILQDITGFVASTLYRGINWIFVPSTLLAQADSCVGSKTSLNYKGFKNLIGTFYPPSEVYIYTPFLTTQSDADYFSGLGEVVKLHLMGGTVETEDLLALLPAIIKREPAAVLQAVRNSLLVKQSYIADDEFDTGRRNLLNFGHCFGHAIESTSRFAVPHGQAVVMGMVLANIVAHERKLLSRDLLDFVAEKLLKPALVVPARPSYLEPQAIIEAMKKDKKRTGAKLPLIMMKDRYEMIKVDDLLESEVERALTLAVGVLSIN